MFVFSFKMTKRIILMLCIAVLGITSLIYMPFRTENYVEVSAPAKISFQASSQEERLFFLAQFGWEAEEMPIEVCEVIIPEVFDPVYEKYNALQKEQSFDLSKHRGRRVKRYTYTICNYPNYDGHVVANILVYREKVIGGDICALSLDGFMHGFRK